MNTAHGRMPGVTGSWIFRKTRMKARIAVLIAAAAISCMAGVATSPQGITLKNGEILPLETGKLLFKADFRGRNPGWANFETYQKNIAHCFETMDGSPVLVIRNPAQTTGDTAWNFQTRKIALKGTEKRLLLEIDCKVTTNLLFDKGNDQWCNRIRWYDADGKEFRSTRFKYRGIPEGFTVTQIPVEVPHGTKSLVVQVGADHPNICGKNYQAYRALRIREGAPEKDYSGTTSFVSQFFRDASGKVSWSGDFPPGSEGKLQIAWASDAGGKPGPWSAFSGPDGTPASFYKNGSALGKFPDSARWFRYKFFLQSGKKAPVLKEVRIGEFTDSCWSDYFDRDTPMVVNTTIPGRKFRKSVSFKVVDSSPIDWKTLRFSVDGQDVTGKAKICGDSVVYTPETPFPDRRHKFTVDVSDVEGHKVSATRYFDFLPVPKNNLVTLRDDGMLLINGKPFFPIGIYAMAKKPWNGNSYYKGFRDVKEAGFNLVHTYCSVRDQSFYKEFFPAAKKYGIKLFIAGPDGANSHVLKPLLDTVRKEKNNPCILCWYLGDDSSRHWTPELLAEFSDAVRTEDPSRLTCQADDGTGRYDGFANCTDIYLPTIYPVQELGPDSGNECVAQTIYDVKYCFERLRLEGKPNVSIWPVIQYFKGWGGWKRYPTHRELRAMSYAAIIHGAQGITWYTYAPGDHIHNYGAASAPENWKVMSSVSRELNQLIPVLCERKAKFQPAVKILSGPEKDLKGYPSVTGLLKIHNKKAYWLTVNSAAAPVTAAFSLPGYKKGKMLFENRDVSLKNGILTEPFAPHDVHIYELE